MTFWLGLAILAQFITAGTVLIDKYLLLRDNHIGKPVVYAFYVSILSGVVLILVPFGYISAPSVLVLELCFATAVAYIFSLLFLYTALKKSVPSDVMPVVGGATAVSSLILANMFLHNELPAHFGLAFILLVIGTFLISRFRFTFKAFLTVIAAGFFFGLSSVLVKIVFLNSAHFIDGFFWSRMANVVGALLLLLWPGTLRAIKQSLKHSGSGTTWIVIANKVLSGLAFILTLRAIQIGNVPLINALGGLQFVFLFLFAYLFAGIAPKIFHGEVRPHEFMHKVFGTLLIVAGLAVIFSPQLLAFII